MNGIRQRIATLWIFATIGLLLAACDSNTVAPMIVYIDTPQPYVDAQSTLDYGQSQLQELSHQATVVGMDMAQAANAAEQATLDSSERQMMELAYQATAVSLNMAQAAATQQFIVEQTQMIWNATADSQSQVATAIYSAHSLNVTQTAQVQAILDLHAAETAHALVITQQFDTDQTQVAWIAEATAQSQAATATYSAYSLNVTKTAQAQAIIDVQATQAAQANATQTAYSLTATPWTAFQAEIVRTRNEAERRALWGEFVVTPLKVILITLVVLLLIVGGVIAYLRLIPVLELRLRTIARYNKSPLLLMDGMIVETNPPRLSSDGTPQVEIVDPSEPSITNWITEAEKELRSDDRKQA